MEMESSLMMKIGTDAPDFKLEGTDNKTYSLKYFNKKFLLVVFMCNHCPYVKAKIKALIELQNKFKDSLQIVGINSNDPDYPGEGFDNMKMFAKERVLNFPYLFDETQKVAKSYGATCTPDSFLFDSDKRLVFHGRINDAMSPDSPVTRKVMEENIQTLLAGKKLDKDFDPSIGCSIKWKE